MTGDDATFDEELLVDGLWLSLIGMGVVFSVLILLALSIKAFDRIDALIPESGSVATAEPVAARTTPTPVASQTAAITEDDDAKTAAAIAVALALAEAESSSSSVGAPAAAPGGLSRASMNTWVAAGRSREMGNRAAMQSPRNRTGR